MLDRVRAGELLDEVMADYGYVRTASAAEVIAYERGPGLVEAYQKASIERDSLRAALAASEKRRTDAEFLAGSLNASAHENQARLARAEERTAELEAELEKTESMAAGSERRCAAAEIRAEAAEPKLAKAVGALAGLVETLEVDGGYTEARCIEADEEAGEEVQPGKALRVARAVLAAILEVEP